MWLRTLANVGDRLINLAFILLLLRISWGPQGERHLARGLPPCGSSIN